MRNSTDDETAEPLRLSSEFRKSTSRGRSIRIFVATPLGHSGRGGIDRLNDAIFDVIGAQPELAISVTRIVTRGQAGLIYAQFVFAKAILKFSTAAVLGKIDLLHIHLSIKGSSYRKILLGYLASKLHIPYIVHLHGCNFDEFWSTTSPQITRGIDLLFLNSARIVVLGQYWAAAIVQRLPEVAYKVEVLPNATWASSQSQLPSEAGRTRITFLGQLGPRKGTPQFVQALALLRDRDGWEATIAGDGAVSETITLIKDLGLSERVSVPGWLSSKVTDGLLSQTDILVLPSFSENLPMAILEAFAHGVPVVSTPVGAIPEVVLNERNGLIVGTGDVEGLAAALRRLINDPEYRKRLGEQARSDHRDKYEIGTYVVKLVSLWRGTVGASITSVTGPVS